MGKRKRKKIERSAQRLKTEKPREDAKKKAEERLAIYTKNYTNKHICDQIRENCWPFKIFIGMALVGCILILVSVVRAAIDIHSDPSANIRLWDAISRDHPVGVVFGTTILIVTGIWNQMCGAHYTFKHLRPACSGRRYSAREIDELANHPDTIWLPEIQVFVTPIGLIGLNHGLTVVDRVDIAGIEINEEKKYLIIRTQKHRRMLLTEMPFADGYKTLIPILEERFGDVAGMIKEDTQKYLPG